MKPWLQNRDIIVWDTETTGLCPLRDRVVQIGAAHFHNGELVRSTSVLVNPGIPIPSAMTAIHGIGDDDVKDAGTFAQALDITIPDGALFVAHHADFDRKMLLVECCRSGLDTAWLLEDRWVCTMALSKALANVTRWAKGHRLTDLCDRYGIKRGGAHNAEHDAVAAGRLLYAIERALPDTLQETLAGQNDWYSKNT